MKIKRNLPDKERLVKKLRNNKQLLIFTVLSITLPMSLLAAFRLTGILQEPPTLETITMDPVSWRMDRPSSSIELGDERVESASTNDEASVGVGVQIVAYRDHALAEPFNGGDGVTFFVVSNATLKLDFTSSFEVRFHPSDSDAFVDVASDHLVGGNVTVTSMNLIGTSTRDANVSATITDSPSYLRVKTHWVFKDQNTESHQLRVLLEFTYRNTSVYKKIVFPIFLEMVPDIGETFDTAKNVTAGEYRGCIDLVDFIDMYSITLQEGQTVNVTLTPPQDTNYDLYLYAPGSDEGTPPVDKSENTGNSSESITHDCHDAGYWYIEVNLTYWGGHENEGIYKLSIDLENFDGGHGGSGCPFFYVWDGQGYVVDNNLLPTSEASNGYDVEDRYKLEQPLVPTYQDRWFSLYSLQVREFEQEHTFLDQAELLAVDHSSDVNIAVTPSGEIVTYRKPQAPIKLKIER